MGEIVFGLIIVVTVVVGSILGLVAFNRTRTLRDEAVLMRRRIADLEAALTGPAPARPAAELPPTQSEAETPPVEYVAPPVEDPVAEEPEPTPAYAAQAADSADAKTTGSPVPPSSSSDGLEQALGGKWAVWVGGVALALGAVFMVKYSIDQGLLDPKTRLILGFLFSLGLLALGEWTRRRGSFFSIPGYESANIPATLTAAGTMGAFASIYVAYGVYNYVGPTLAFLGMGAVALGALVAALLHGPALAALGLLGAYVAPLLVSTEEPVPWSLALYILLVSAAAYTVARWRLWRWLAGTASAGLVLYGLLLHAIGHDLTRLRVDFYLAIAFAMAAYVYVISFFDKDETQQAGHEKPALIVLSTLMLIALPHIQWSETSALNFIEMAVILTAGFGLAWLYPAVRGLIPTTVFVVLLRYLALQITPRQASQLADDIYASGGEQLPFMLSVENTGPFLIMGLVLAAIAIGIAVRASTRGTSRTWLASGSTVLALAILAIAWLRVEKFANSFTFFLIALGLVAVFAVAALYLMRAQSGMSDAEAEPLDGPISVFATGAFAALALAASIVLEKGFLTIALALIVLAMAYTYSHRPLKGMRAAAVVLMAIWAIRVLANPAIVGGDLGTTPIFNWLLYGWGLSTLAFIGACWFFRTGERDRWLTAIEGVTIAAGTITIAVLLIHAWNPAELFTEIDKLPEAAFITMTGAAVALGLLHIRAGESQSVNWGIDILGYGGMAAAVLTLVLAFNPVFTGEEVGTGWLFNSLLIGYLAPALLFGVLAWRAYPVRPYPYGLAATATAGILGFAWVTLMVRQTFHGNILAPGTSGQDMSNAELYAYSIVWLVMGIGLLLAGIFLNRRLLRIISAGLIVLVVVKVFLIDMGNLTGFWRALSFIGLGIVLVGIGLLYQRLLAPTAPQPKEENA